MDRLHLEMATNGASEINFTRLKLAVVYSRVYIF